MNSKDLCLLPYLDEVIACGVDSLKIEGRMKSVHYVASVVRTYRMALDTCMTDAPYRVQDAWLTELEKVSHRPYTTGFFFGKTTEKDQIYGTSTYAQSSDFVGVVRGRDPKTGIALVEQRNRIFVGEELEVFPPTGTVGRFILDRMWDETGVPIEVAPHPRQIVRMEIPWDVAADTILRRDTKNEEEL